ncbi:MAG TPA: phosphoribosylanthranilate isomerase [Terracidiphilus sp.]|nr:phosphoribosylanthranilate isomerase [Terracidiphilus sp.]
MSLWIKICGNTSLADAKLAADCGADALGFVFAASPRRVTAEQVAGIVPSLSPSVEKIGVFVDANFDEICRTVDACVLTGVQLHGESTANTSCELRARFGPSLRILRVIHFNTCSAAEAGALAGDPNTDAILVDSRTEAAVGGTGKVFDWDAARDTLFCRANGQKLIAAGGLSPANVVQAIKVLRPWGVDVVSGVEAAPGRKDPEKVRAFIDHARAAART